MQYVSTTEGALAAQPALFRHSTDFLLADVIFGSPREDCAGTGICKIEALGHSPAAAGVRECRRARAVLTAPDPHSLQIRIRQTDLCTQLFRQYFREDRFRLPQSCPLDAALVQQLQLAGDVLRAGVYQIGTNDGCFCLILSV